MQIGRYTTWGGNVEPNSIDLIESTQIFESGGLGHSYAWARLQISAANFAHNERIIYYPIDDISPPRE